MTTPSRPLVTFYLMAYNQARFVREAVEGALAQTYGPMELLLSDDCSTDGTFDIIRDAVKGYSGPHKIILNRNASNLGVSAHLNRIMELSSGELVVSSDGDDVSTPERTERCVEAWLKNGKPAALVSSVRCIDAAGNPTRNGDQWFAQFLPTQEETAPASLFRFSKEGSPRLISCSAAWTKEAFDAFGPLAPGIFYEDDVLTLRAWLYDRIVFIREALVSYREHESNLHNRAQPVVTSPRARQDAELAASTQARHRRETLMSYLPDLQLALRQQWIERPAYDQLKGHVEARCKLHQVVEAWWDVGWTRRLGCFVCLLLAGRVKEARWCSPRLLPFSIFLHAGAVWSRARTMRPAAWSVFMAIGSMQSDVIGVLYGG
jgi:GT2 family glycosyltransferase